MDQIGCSGWGAERVNELVQTRVTLLLIDERCELPSIQVESVRTTLFQFQIKLAWKITLQKWVGGYYLETISSISVFDISPKMNWVNLEVVNIDESIRSF